MMIFLKWMEHTEVAVKLRKIIKYAKNLSKNEEKSLSTCLKLLVPCLNPFFRWFWAPKKPISASDPSLICKYNTVSNRYWCCDVKPFCPYIDVSLAAAKIQEALFFTMLDFGNFTFIAKISHSIFAKIIKVKSFDTSEETLKSSDLVRKNLRNWTLCLWWCVCRCVKNFGACDDDTQFGGNPKSKMKSTQK